MIVVYRKVAKAAGLKRYFTGQPCRHGHVAERLVSNLVCLACADIRIKRYRVNNRGKLAVARRSWAARNPERNRAIRKACSSTPKAKADQAVRSRRWREKNRERANQQRYAYAKRNLGKMAALSAKYRADKMRQTPGWADLAAIEAIYQSAAEGRATGVPLTVDHVIPLRGDTVSGLHVAGNLQVLHDIDNKRKSNRLHV